MNGPWLAMAARVVDALAKQERLAEEVIDERHQVQHSHLCLCNWTTITPHEGSCVRRLCVRHSHSLSTYTRFAPDLLTVQRRAVVACGAFAHAQVVQLDARRNDNRVALGQLRRHGLAKASKVWMNVGQVSVVSWGTQLAIGRVCAS